MFKNMPWKSGDEKKEDEEGSLTSILKTTEQQKELFLLIANCTESLRHSITDNFNAQATKQDSKSSTSNTQPSSGNGNGKNPNLQNADIDAEQVQREKDKLAEREEELSQPKMLEIKAAALEFFEEWRDAVLQRVGEVVQSKEAAKRQKHEAKPQLPPRRESKRLSPSLDKRDESVGSVLREL